MKPFRHFGRSSDGEQNDVAGTPLGLPRDIEILMIIPPLNLNTENQSYINVISTFHLQK